MSNTQKLKDVVDTFVKANKDLDNKVNKAIEDNRQTRKEIEAKQTRPS